MPPDATAFPCRAIPSGVEFSVLASAGSARAGVRGVHGEALKVAVQAPPEKGKANGAIEAVLAEFLGLPRRQVKVVAGHTSRRKRVQAVGLGPAELRAKLALA